jgi:hypothetical protein
MQNRDARPQVRRLASAASIKRASFGVAAPRACCIRLEGLAARESPSCTTWQPAEFARIHRATTAHRNDTCLKAAVSVDATKEVVLAHRLEDTVCDATNLPV